jgi:pyruvate dehydrogenase E2 component (dihydrolipoamide acetyltransferase)
LGAIIDTVVPRTKQSDGESDWEVAPIMVATLSVDHRVVDGAVAAQWLSAFKQLAENPINLLL